MMVSNARMSFFNEHLTFANLNSCSPSIQSDDSIYEQGTQTDITASQILSHLTNADEYNQILLSSGPMNSSWPMQSHDNRHTGLSPFSTASNPGAEKWRFRCGTVYGGPAIAEDGTIYFGDQGYPDYLYAVYPNGTLRWKYELKGQDLVHWVWSTPAISENGMIYIGDFAGYLFALNSNGSFQWQYYIADTSIVSSPAIAPDGTIYFGTETGSDEGYIYALNPDHTMKWRYLTGFYIISDPAIGPDGTIYIGSMDDYLYAMNPNGELKWRFKTDDWVRGQASIAPDGTVYIGSFDGFLYALYPDNGTLKWKCQVGPSEGTPAIAADGTIYVGSDYLYAVYPNGTLRWKYYPGSSEIIAQSCPAISADGTIYVGTVINLQYGGHIIAVNPDGTERWRKLIANTLIDSSPAIDSNGIIYIGSASGDNAQGPYGFLHAFGPGPLQVDVNGPYAGELNTPIQFHCTVFGGIPPYSYLWSFGDGGTSSAENPTHTYTISGTYKVTLQVTDSEGNVTSNDTTAVISAPPNTPVINGPPKGRHNQEYSYTFVTTDPEGDDIYYYIRWGDDATGWIGPYTSGTEITQSHTWVKRGTYTIQCKAKDVHGWESGWGTLQVTMPLSYDPPHFRFFDWLFERFPNAFPILRHLLHQ